MVFYFVFIVILFLEIRSHCVVQALLQDEVHLSQCQEQRHVATMIS